jgi:purine-binding chemotaxis protein CheW
VTAASEVELVVFRLGEEEYALELAEVREILRSPEIVPLVSPASPAIGRVMYGAEWLPVVSVGELLGRPVSDRVADASRLLIARHSAARKVGLLVDEVHEVVAVPTNRLAEPPPIFGSRDRSRVRSLVALPDERLVILISMEDLLDRSRLEQMANAVSSDGPSDHPTLRQDEQ